MSFHPSHIALYNKGNLHQIAEILEKHSRNCRICPRECGVNRIEGEHGFCTSGVNPIVSSASPHFGEERPLVGRNGSGTIFFSNCNLSCVYCQNYDISQLGYGREISSRELADHMLALQNRGCHNINFVSPTHMIYPIIRALLEAIPLGLDVPLVYNSGGYDSIETLKIIEGVFDIYMPDFKYWDSKDSWEYSRARNYPEIAAQAIKEMYNQVGDLYIDGRGIARRGLLVRHLVLPGKKEDSKKIMDFLFSISPDTYVNVMDQYRPSYRSSEFPGLRKRLMYDEYKEVLDYARKTGLRRADRA